MTKTITFRLRVFKVTARWGLRLGVLLPTRWPRGLDHSCILAGRVLLSRAMKGCYVYFMDKETENFFRSRTEEAVLEYE